MLLISAVRPNAPGAREGEFFIQHLHTGVVRADHFRFEQYLFGPSVQRLQQTSALRQPAAHGLAGDVGAVPRKDLLLPVQGQVVGSLSDNHLRQQAGPRGALLNRLRRLGGGPHGAVASILLAYILDDFQLRRNIFVALAGLLPDGPQILLTSGAMLFLFRQVMHDPLALETLRESLPT